MDINVLKQLICVAEELNITRAAEKLYIAQPSLSQTIKRIEKKIGHKLFQRSSSGLTLTPAGHRFIELSKRIIEEKESLDYTLHCISQFQLGQLSLGISSFWSSYILPIALPEFRRVYPNIEIAIKEATSSKLEGMLLRDEIDIAIMTLPIFSEEITYTELLQEDVLIAISKENRLSKKGMLTPGKEYPSIDPELIRDQPFILAWPGFRLRQSADAFFAAHNINPRILIYSISIETMKRLTANDLGISFIPKIYSYAFASSNDPAYFYTNDDTLPGWTLTVAYQKKNKQNTMLITFIKLLQRILGKTGNS